MQYFLNVLTDVVYPGSSCEINQDKYNSKTLDQEVSMDAFVNQLDLPRQSIQIKCRRADKFKFFKRKKDLLLNIKKTHDDGRTYEGDYTKCQSDLFMYGFSNGCTPEDSTGLDYWALINYTNLKNKFIKFGGYKNVPGVFPKDYRDGKIVTQFIVIPWDFVRSCIIKTSETLEEISIPL